MRVFMDKLALLISCFLFQLYYYKNPGTMHVLALLAALTFICLCTYCNPDLLSIQDFSPHFRYLEIGLCLFFWYRLSPCHCLPAFCHYCFMN